jgi:hypothetical protein
MITGLITVLRAIGRLIVEVVGLLVDLVVGIALRIVEGIDALFGVIGRIFTELPGMFDGFTALLSAVFVFVPSEFVLIITLGMLLLVLAAIIKRFLG